MTRLTQLSVRILAVAAASLGVPIAALACDAPKVTYKLSHPVNPDERHPFHAAALAFKKAVEEKTNCDVAISIFPSGQLGTDRETFEALTVGTQDFAIVSSAPLSAFSPAFEGLTLPWLFNGNLELQREVISGEPGKKVFEQFMQDTGARALGVVLGGFRHIVSTAPITSNEQLSGLKMRVMQNPINIATFSAIGANPTPLAYPEVYGALETGVVQAFDSDLVGFYAAKLYEVAKNVTYTGHFNSPGILVVGEGLFESLDPAVQTAVLEAGAAGADAAYNVTKEQEGKVKELLEEKGVKFYEIDVQKLRDAMGPVYETARNSSPGVGQFIDDVTALAAKSN
jgi:tripartite ATP-independent transporter DctP family solute receptor